MKDKRRTKPIATRHIYKVEKTLKNYTVYSLMQVDDNKQSMFDQFVRIEKYQGFSRAKGVDYYFRTKNTNNWHTSKSITGLWYLQGLFYGDDRTSGKSLIIISFHNQYMILDYFKAYYPSSQLELMEILKISKKAHQRIDMPFLDDIKSMQLDLFNKDSKN